MNKRRLMALTLGGAILIIGVASAAYYLAGGDSEPEPGTDDSENHAGEYQTFTDEVNGFRISYPAAWVQGQARSGAEDADFLATPPGTENAVSVSTVTFEEPVTIDSRTRPELVSGVEDVLDRTVDSMPGVVEIIQRRRIRVQDVQGWTYIYRFEDEASRVGVHVKHFLFRGNNAYTLTFQAFPEENYAALAEDFDRILDSFEFLGNRDPEPAESVPNLEDSATNEERRFDDPLVQNTYEIAVTLCSESEPSALAEEYGVADSSDLDGIARAYSMDSVERRGHRDAAYVGCLEGLTAE